MLNGFLHKTADVLARWQRNRRKPHLDSHFYELLDAVIEWKVNAEFCRREAEENTTWAQAFDSGTALRENPRNKV